MQSILTRCPVCKSLRQDALCPSFYNTLVTPLQEIVLCSDCGCVFRNPHIPDICESAYVDVDNWGSENPDFTERFDRLCEELAHEVPLKPHQLYLDIGSGPGWLTQRMQTFFPEARAVILEPSLKVAEHAKQRNPRANVLPAMLSDATLPKSSFSLITACGVDYLFQDHRADLEKILELLHDGGIFYIERNVFVDSAAYYQQPIFDIDDYFGLNARMNTWFLRDQFGEYLSEFFEVVKRTDRVFDTTPEPYSRKNTITGYYCKKRTGGKRKQVTHVNNSGDSLRILQTRVQESSIEDLKLLSEQGFATVSVAGTGDVAETLLELIKAHDIFDIACVLDTNSTNFVDNPLQRRFGTTEALETSHAILMASCENQYPIYQRLRESGISGSLFPCIRGGAPFFRSLDASKFQVKAFMPLWNAEHLERDGNVHFFEDYVPETVSTVRGETSAVNVVNRKDMQIY